MRQTTVKFEQQSLLTRASGIFAFRLTSKCCPPTPLAKKTKRWQVWTVGVVGSWEWRVSLLTFDVGLASEPMPSQGLIFGPLTWLKDWLFSLYFPLYWIIFFPRSAKAFVQSHNGWKIRRKVLCNFAQNTAYWKLFIIHSGMFFFKDLNLINYAFPIY